MPMDAKEIEQLIKEHVCDVMFFVPLEHRFMRFLFVTKAWVKNFFFHPFMRD